jgi:hypothetical protein
VILYPIIGIKDIQTKKSNKNNRIIPCQQGKRNNKNRHKNRLYMYIHIVVVEHVFFPADGFNKKITEYDKQGLLKLIGAQQKRV